MRQLMILFAGLAFLASAELVFAQACPPGINPRAATLPYARGKGCNKIEDCVKRNMCKGWHRCQATGYCARGGR